MKNKKYTAPQAELVIFQAEDIMALSLNATNGNVTEDSISINDLF